MSKLFTLFFLVGLFLSASAAKDNNINGSVIAEGKPISGAVVYLLKDTGSAIVKTTITDADGKFSFNSALVKFRISVNAMGYNEFTSSIKQAGLPIEAVLTPSEKQMTSVTVVAQRKLVEVRTDKTVINVDAAPTNIGTTALEVLEKAPGVMVDKDGNISMLGKAGVVIMIDGNDIQY